MQARNKRIHSRLCTGSPTKRKKTIPERDLVKAMYLDRGLAIDHVPHTILSNFLQLDENFSKLVKFVKETPWQTTPLHALASKVSDRKRTNQVEARRLVQFYIDHHIPVHVYLTCSVRRFAWRNRSEEVRSHYGTFRIVHQRSAGARLENIDGCSIVGPRAGLSWSTSPQLRKYVWDQLVGVKSKETQIEERLQGNPGCPLDTWGMYLGIVQSDDDAYVHLKRRPAAGNEHRYRAELAARLSPAMPELFRSVSAQIGNHATAITLAFLAL